MIDSGKAEQASGPARPHLTAAATATYADITRWDGY
jgi:hypothetical protein